MDQLRGLPLDRQHQIRVAMPEDVHRNARRQNRCTHAPPGHTPSSLALAQSRLVDVYKSPSNNVQRFLQFFCRHDRRIPL